MSGAAMGTGAASSFVAAAGPTTVEAAAVNTEDLRRAYYEGPGSGWDWWIREIDLDPSQLIVENDAEGRLYRVPYTIAADGEITFGEEIPVQIEYIDVAAATTAENSAARFVAASRTIGARTPLLVYASRAQARPKASTTTPQPAPSTTSEPQEGTMKLTKEQLARLGLPEDATDEAISEALDKALTATGSDEGGDGNGGDAGESGESEGGDGGGQAPAETPATPGTGSEPGVQQQPDSGQPTQAPATEGVTVPPGMRLIDEAVLADLQSGVKDAQELVSAARKKERDDLLDGAIRAGKFPKARREHYEALLAADPEGTKAMIAQLSAGLVPVEELGVGDTGDEPVAGAGQQDAYPESWGRQVKAANRGIGKRVKVVND